MASSSCRVAGQHPLVLLPRDPARQAERVSNRDGGTGTGTGPSWLHNTHASETTYRRGSGAHGTLPILTAPSTSLKRRPRFLPRMVSSVPPSSGPRSGSICGTEGQGGGNRRGGFCLRPQGCARAHVPLSPWSGQAGSSQARSPQQTHRRAPSPQLGAREAITVFGTGVWAAITPAANTSGVKHHAFHTSVSNGFGAETKPETREPRGGMPACQEERARAPCF